MRKPEANEFKEWREHHVTQWVFEEIGMMAKDYAEAMGGGASYYDKSMEMTALKTAESVGFIDGLKAITRIELK